MPLLAVDKYGRFYETSPDRSDGSGYKGHAPAVKRSDVTYGANYHTHERKHKQSVIKNRKQIGEQERYDTELRHARVLQLIEQKRRDKIKEHMMKNPLIQRQLMQKAMNYGCARAASASKPSDTQKAIMHHMSGMGEDPSISVGPSERSRMRHQERAEIYLKLQAKQLDAKRRLEAEQAANLKRAQQMKAALWKDQNGSKPIGRSPASRRPVLMKKVDPMIMHPYQLMQRVK